MGDALLVLRGEYKFGMEVQGEDRQFGAEGREAG